MTRYAGDASYIRSSIDDITEEVVFAKLSERMKGGVEGKRIAITVDSYASPR